MVYTSSLTGCRTTEDLGSEEIRKYQETVQTSLNASVVLSLLAKIELLLILEAKS